MEVNQSSKQVKFRETFSWLSVPYDQHNLVKSTYFYLQCPKDLVRCRLSAYRFQSSYVTVLHVQVEKFCLTKPYSAADITITLSDGASRSDKASDWHQESNVFCFSNKVGGNQWRPDIKCEIDWYGFITAEEWRNARNQKSDPLEEFLFSPHKSDISFVVGNEILPAHWSLLQYSSPILCAYFEELDPAPKNVTIRITNFDANTMKEMLTFLYTGKFKTDNFVTWASVVKLAQFYKMENLKNYCASRIDRFLGEHNTLHMNT